MTNIVMIICRLFFYYWIQEPLTGTHKIIIRSYIRLSSMAHMISQESAVKWYIYCHTCVNCAPDMMLPSACRCSLECEIKKHHSDLCSKILHDFSLTHSQAGFQDLAGNFKSFLLLKILQYIFFFELPCCLTTPKSAHNPLQPKAIITHPTWHSHY